MSGIIFLKSPNVVIIRMGRNEAPNPFVFLVFSYFIKLTVPIVVRIIATINYRKTIGTVLDIEHIAVAD